jgi:hypothetical protein
MREIMSYNSKGYLNITQSREKGQHVEHLLAWYL